MDSIGTLLPPLLSKNELNDQLIKAVRYTNSIKKISALITAGADVNAKTPDDWTPLRCNIGI